MCNSCYQQNWLQTREKKCSTDNCDGGVKTRGLCSRCFERAYRATPEGRRRLRESQIKSKYNLTWERYEQLRDQQEGRCAACNRPEEVLNRGLVVDHCHATGKVRGLLCDGCNTAIGHFREDVQAMAGAIEYLKAHGKH